VPHPLVGTNMPPHTAPAHGPDTLLIFVGHSDDGAELTRCIADLGPELQKALDNFRLVNASLPFARVTVWLWEDDATATVAAHPPRGRGGGRPSRRPGTAPPCGCPCPPSASERPPGRSWSPPAGANRPSPSCRSSPPSPPAPNASWTTGWPRPGATCCGSAAS